MGEIIGWTLVGGNLKRISSNLLKLGHMVHQDRYFCRTFLRRLRRVLGRTLVSENLGITSVSKKFQKYSGKKKQIGRKSAGGLLSDT